MSDMLAHHWAWACMGGGMNADWGDVGRHYYCDPGGGPKYWPAIDVAAWIAWYSAANRRIANTLLPPGIVSTIFTGYDIGPVEFKHSRPTLWQTALFFKAAEPISVCTYTSYADARIGHDLTVDDIRKGGWPLRSTAPKRAPEPVTADEAQEFSRRPRSLKLIDV